MKVFAPGFVFICVAAAGGYAEQNSEPVAPPSSQATSSKQPASPEDKAKTRAYWQRKFQKARQELEQAKDLQMLAEDQLNLLQIQEVREVDPHAKTDLTAEVQAKQSEVDADKATTMAAQRALDDLEKAFKDSGAPPDWSKDVADDVSLKGKSSANSASEGTEKPSNGHDARNSRSSLSKLQDQLGTDKRELDVLQQKLGQNQSQYYPDPSVTLRQEYSRGDINKLAADIAAKKQQIADEEKSITGH